MKEKSHKSDMQADRPKSLIFSGIISDRTIIGIVKIPNDATKMTNENEMRGTQLKASTGYPLVFNITYTPITVKPKAVPKLDTANRNCGGIAYF